MQKKDENPSSRNGTKQPNVVGSAGTQQKTDTGSKNTNKPVVALSPTGVLPDGSTQWKAHAELG